MRGQVWALQAKGRIFLSDAYKRATQALVSSIRNLAENEEDRLLNCRKRSGAHHQGLLHKTGGKSGTRMTATMRVKQKYTCRTKNSAQSNSWPPSRVSSEALILQYILGISSGIMGRCTTKRSSKTEANIALNTNQMCQTRSDDPTAGGPSAQFPAK